MKIYAQCSANKLTHLLSADIMRNHTVWDDPEEGWEDWNVFLVEDTESMSRGFLADICGQGSLPDHSLFIAQISQADGRLGLLFPSQPKGGS